jgi:hypothetical protein
VVCAERGHHRGARGETVTEGKERHMAASTVEVFVAAFGNEDEADAAVKDFKAWIGKERSS